MRNEFFEYYNNYPDEDSLEVNEVEKYEEEMKLQFLRDALAEIEKMPEEDVCILYNTETKEEARQSIIEYWC